MANIGHIIIQVVEKHTSSKIRVTHQITQVVEEPVSPSRIAHELIQVGEFTQPLIRVAHIVVQVVEPAGGLGGLYYINPVKMTNHDSYYNNVEKKIPDPFIRTGKFGQ